LSLLPAKPQVLLSDNGSEFEADFAKTLDAHGIARWYTYPKTPKMNAHIERFNRTIQESFVDYHEELLLPTSRTLQPETGRLAGVLQHPAPPPSTRPETTPIIPPPTSTRVPKVVDS
jgi:transposase InsO family protein